MKRKHLELGILRLYYVIWALWVFGGALIAGDNLTNERTFQLLDGCIWVGMTLVLPPALMYAVRWVYRGFVPSMGQEWT